jgi:hypothetical protein
MKSERRDTPRIPIALEAIVSTSKSGYTRTVTRDVSLDGAFVVTGKQKVGKRKPVELALKLPFDGEEKFHRFRAQVVRTAGGGSGVLFEGVDSEAYAALLNLVFSRQPKPAR